MASKTAAYFVTFNDIKRPLYKVFNGYSPTSIRFPSGPVQARKPIDIIIVKMYIHYLYDSMQPMAIKQNLNWRCRRKTRYPMNVRGRPVMNQWRFKLLYDGECPLCRREARFLQARNRRGWLAFEDITAPGFDPALYHTTRENLMGVIHGVFPDGRMVQRVEVFREAYRAVGLGWVLAPTAWPGLRWLADRGYEWFARHRLAIGKFFGRRCESGVCVMADRTGSGCAAGNSPPRPRN